MRKIICETKKRKNKKGIKTIRKQKTFYEPRIAKQQINWKATKLKTTFERKLPKFNPLPVHLANLRRGIAPFDFARFYGNFVTLTGKLKRFSFQVRMGAQSSGAEKYTKIRIVCQNLLQNKVPVHEPGQIFSFDELLHKTHWTLVRRIAEYKVGMQYG